MLYLESLSQIIRLTVEDKRWTPFSVGKYRLGVSHLCFADDTVLFAEAKIEQLETIMYCLNQFCEASGQKFSVSKTRIFFSKNVQWQVGFDIAGISGFSTTSDLGKYLGVPLLHKRVSKNTYAYLVDKMQRRLAG